mmetsp:Transcript_5117/g.5241  ORF Transcript_5117/g.5241 Transcript_5117/m.5241 type:complete len:196 (-) Transcript_5117:58-645(-)
MKVNIKIVVFGALVTAAILFSAKTHNVLESIITNNSSRALADSVLVSKTGKLVKASKVLDGKEVGLYFAAQWCGLTRNFTPHITEFHEQTPRNIELILVSSDLDEKTYNEHFYKNCGNWYALQYNDPLNEYLKKKYRIWSGREKERLGSDRRAGIPSILVVTAQGDEVLFVEAEKRGGASLHEWAVLDSSAVWSL